MKKTIILILSLTALKVFGQTEIQKAEYKISYRYGCFSYSYNYETPILKTVSKYDKRQIINDSVASVANHFKFNIDDKPHFTDYNECPQIYEGTEEYGIDYLVTFNTDSFLSIIINSTHVNGNGGHGTDVGINCFNLDLLNNQFITIDSLFSSINKIDLHNFIPQIENKIIRDGVGDSEFDLFLKGSQMFGHLDNNSYFVGVNVDSTYLILHYSFYMGNSINNISDIKLPLTEIKRFINKKYLWL